MQETPKFLGHGVCDATNRSTTTNYFLAEASCIFKEIKALYLRQNVIPQDLRGLGIQLSRLEKEQMKNGFLKDFLNNSKKNDANIKQEAQQKSEFNEQLAKSNVKNKNNG